MSKLIVIEGLDGSGKSTQLELLISALEKDGKRVRKIKPVSYTHLTLPTNSRV